MKACPATKVLREMQRAGIWIDAVSGNEILRALHAGHSKGQQPPSILYTSDVFRDNALQVVLEQGILPNIGSAGMIDELNRAGYSGDVSIRINPGFGHGHKTCFGIVYSDFGHDNWSPTRVIRTNSYDNDDLTRSSLPSNLM
jgi:diaminopimelate decarboxylase